MVLVSFLKRRGKTIALLLSWVLLLFLAVNPNSGALTGDAFRLYWRAIFSGDYLWVVGIALMMLAGLVALNTRLESLQIKWLEWSPFGIKANMTLLPLQRKWSGLVYAGLLAFCVPVMAWFEEVIFRDWIHGPWVGLVWGGIVFGTAHLVACVTVRMVICLSLLGVVLVQVYALVGGSGAGLAAVFLVHATYNLITLSIIIFEMRIREPLGIWLAQHRLVQVHLPTVTPWLLKTNEWYT